MTRFLRLTRDHLSLLGDLPPWVWLLAIIVAGAGCDASIGDGSTGAALVASLGGFAYAVRVRVTSDARTAGAVVDALAARDREIADLRVTHRADITALRVAYDADLAQMRLVIEAAYGRERLAVQRLDALADEMETLRAESMSQRSDR